MRIRSSALSAVVLPATAGLGAQSAGTAASDYLTPLPSIMTVPDGAPRKSASDTAIR